MYSSSLVSLSFFSISNKYIALTFTISSSSLQYHLAFFFAFFLYLHFFFIVFIDIFFVESFSISTKAGKLYCLSIVYIKIRCVLFWFNIFIIIYCFFYLIRIIDSFTILIFHNISVVAEN